jgi:predicted nucleic-acid-binding protein
LIQAMRAVDTNVLARWVLGDDTAQVELATKALSEPVFVPLTVLLELGWVLHKALGFAREVAATMLEQVLDIETASVEHGEIARWAVGRFRSGADWGNMLHIAAASRDGTEFLTFDRRMPRRAGQECPLPVRVLCSGEPAIGRGDD